MKRPTAGGSYTREGNKLTCQEATKLPGHQGFPAVKTEPEPAIDGKLGKASAKAKKEA